MKNELKRLFSATTDEVTYKKEIITHVILLLIFVLPIIFTYFGLIIPYKSIRFIIAVIIFIDFYPCMIFCGIRMLHISDNREKLKHNKGIKKGKLPTIKYSYKAILYWLENAIIPDTLYIVSNRNEHHCLEISFEVNGFNKPFVNKKYFFDHDEMVSISNIEKMLEQNEIIDKDGYIAIEGITDYNNPSLFQKILNEINYKESF